MIFKTSYFKYHTLLEPEITWLNVNIHFTTSPQKTILYNVCFSLDVTLFFQFYRFIPMSFQSVKPSLSVWMYVCECMCVCETKRDRDTDRESRENRAGHTIFKAWCKIKCKIPCLKLLRITRWWQQNINPNMEPFWAQSPVWLHKFYAHTRGRDEKREKVPIL